MARPPSQTKVLRTLCKAKGIRPLGSRKLVPPIKQRNYFHKSMFFLDLFNFIYFLYFLDFLDLLYFFRPSEIVVISFERFKAKGIRPLVPQSNKKLFP